MQTSNKVVDFLKSRIGSKLKESPSAVTAWLEGILKEVEAGEITITYIIRPEMTNPAKTLHGGIASTIIDDAIGLAVYSLNNEFYYTTVNLSVDFLSAAQIGEEITAKASIIRKGSRLINTFCTIYGADERIIARGTSNLIVTSTSLKR